MITGLAIGVPQRASSLNMKPAGMGQEILYEARLTGQVQIKNPRYVFLCAHDRSSRHLSSCRSLSRNGSALHTCSFDRQAKFMSHCVCTMISASTCLLLVKAIVFTFIVSVAIRTYIKYRAAAMIGLPDRNDSDSQRITENRLRCFCCLFRGSVAAID